MIYILKYHHKPYIAFLWFAVVILPPLEKLKFHITEYKAACMLHSFPSLHQSTHLVQSTRITSRKSNQSIEVLHLRLAQSSPSPSCRESEQGKAGVKQITKQLFYCDIFIKCLMLTITPIIPSIYLCLFVLSCAGAALEGGAPTLSSLGHHRAVTPRGSCASHWELSGTNHSSNGIPCSQSRLTVLEGYVLQDSEYTQSV